MLRAFAVLFSCLILNSYAMAIEISDTDRAAMKSLFGENFETDLQLSLIKKNSDKDHQLYLLRTLAADSDFSAPQQSIVPAEEKLQFCGAYIEVLTQVIVDEKPALIQLVHTEGDRRFTGYGFRHLARFIKNEPIRTAEERSPKAAATIASKTAQVNTLKIQNFGYAKHLQLVERCRGERPIYADKSANRFHDQRYISLMDRLKALDKNSSRGTNNGGAASNGSVR